MQKSDRIEGKHKIRAESSVVMRTCPRCGGERTRISMSKPTDGLLNRLLRKPCRCQTCRYRFWVMDRLRLIWLTCIILALVPVFGFVWMMFNKQPPVANSAQVVASIDQIKSLAEKGDAEAELQMGLRYPSIADEKIAAQWFEKAAQHGKVLAQYRYGLALLKGQGVVQDYKKASYWLEKAARQGNAEAQFALGEMYHSGTGIIKDDVERAYLWFNLAAAQGLDKAAASRDLVVQMLTSKQIAAMQEEAGRISRNQYSGPVASEPKSELKEHASEVPDGSTAKANEPAVKLKKRISGVVDKSSANRSIPAYGYSGRAIPRKKVEPEENVPGVVDNRYSGRTARRSTVRLTTQAPRVVDNPSANRLMPGVNSPMPEVKGLIPELITPVPGVNGPMPDLNSSIPGVNRRMHELNRPMPGLQRPVSKEKMPPVKY
jgi:uncharacterized protein